MDKNRRRELVADYKEIKKRPGIFAVRCAASGEAWVSPSPDVATQQNGIWFTLRMGNHPNKALQAAWNAHGDATFSFEVLEEIEDETLTGYLLTAQLKDRAAAWREALNAKPVTG